MQNKKGNKKEKMSINYVSIAIKHGISCTCIDKCFPFRARSL